MKLTLLQRRGIRNWLKLNRREKHHKCPFMVDQSAGSAEWDKVYANDCQKVCPAIFPGLTKKRTDPAHIFVSCPCACYKKDYVIRVARVTLARHGVIKERRKNDN